MYDNVVTFKPSVSFVKNKIQNLYSSPLAHTSGAFRH